MRRKGNQLKRCGAVSAWQNSHFDRRLWGGIVSNTRIPALNYIWTFGQSKAVVFKAEKFDPEINPKLADLCRRSADPAVAGGSARKGACSRLSGCREFPLGSRQIRVLSSRINAGGLPLTKSAPIMNACEARILALTRKRPSDGTTHYQQLSTGKGIGHLLT